jgi:hypothetical protein
MKKVWWVVIVLVLAFLVFLIFNINCTLLAEICPDGSVRERYMFTCLHQPCPYYPYKVAYMDWEIAKGFIYNNSVKEITFSPKMMGVSMFLTDNITEVRFWGDPTGSAETIKEELEKCGVLCQNITVQLDIPT